MKRIAFAVLCLVVSALNASAASIRVVDEAGQPVDDFEILLRTAQDSRAEWTAGTGGAVEADEALGSAPALDVSVRAPGFAPFAKKLTGDEKVKLLAGEAALTLSKGKAVVLKLNLAEGVTLPEGFEPLVYFHEQVTRRIPIWAPKSAEQAKSDPMVLAVEAGEDGYRLNLGEEPRAFVVSINEPGVLRFFEAGPFTVNDAKEGVISFDVPAPATVKSGLKVEDGVEVPFEKVQFSLMGMHPRERAYFVPETVTKEASEAGEFEVTDLPPGMYQLSVRTIGAGGDAQAQQGTIDPARFSDRRAIQLTPGETEEAVVAFVPFDENSFRGERSVAISVLTQAGTPAAGKSVKVSFNDPHYGVHVIHEGTVPDDGIVSLEGVSDGSNYMLEVNGERLGAIEVKPVDELQELEFRLAPGIGDPAPDIEFTAIATNETKRLAEFAGKPVFLEFWATWCGPCQAPLEKVDGLIEKHADWEGKIEFLPISIDNEIGLVSPHLEGKGWTNLPQYWTGTEGAIGFRSPAATTYVVRGIPNAMLIDAEGTIVWRGHPMAIDLEAEINKMLGLEAVEGAEATEAASSGGD